MYLQVRQTSSRIDSMKKIFILIILSALLILGIKQAPVFAETTRSIVYNSPCESPKTFSIKVVDPRFDISRDELISVSEEAAKLWKNDNGETLFVYDPDAELSINMIYDERQYYSSKVSELNNEVEKDGGTLKPEIDEYERRAAEFNTKMDQLNAQINYWNSQGGAPPEQFEALTREQQQLQQEASELEQIAVSLNQSTDQYNNKVRTLDQQVDVFNQTIEQKPEQGEYIRTASDERINIYFNTSREELIHTLAHEMGHALGIDHNDNTNSVMYPKTTTVIALSADDITAQKEACRPRSIVERVRTNLSLLYNNFQESRGQSISE